MKNSNQFYHEGSTLLIFCIGIIFCLIGVSVLLYKQSFSFESFSYIFLSVGCSIVAAAIIPILIQRFAHRYIKIYRLESKWGINNIYKTRSDMNVESNKDIESCKKCIDICAIGLTGFRNHLGSIVEKKVQDGVKLRVLSPDPESSFLSVRDSEENHTKGQLKKNVEDMCLWIDDLKSKAPLQENVQIRLYTALPQSSYMRVDNKVFIGHYMYKKLSQQTISFSFNDGEVLRYYSEYFESLWNNNKFCTPYIKNSIHNDL